MLVLSRMKDEIIKVGDNIEIMVVAICGDKVKIGIKAPSETPIHRLEVYNAIQREQSGEGSCE